MATWLGSVLHLRTRASRRLAGAAGMTLLLCGVAWAASTSALAARGGIAILGGPEAGSEAGELDRPQDVAVNQTGAGGVAAGTVYVADERNDRIDQFGPAGAFVRAFGLNVGGAGVDVCAATCVAGTANGAAGAMNRPQGVAVDQSDGSVYVADQGERRVDKFTAAGDFVWAAGWNVDGTTPAAKFEVCTAASGDTCRRGANGANAGEFSSLRIGGIAVNPTNGQVLVADPANRRIQRFAADGSFLAAFGWDVIPAGKPGDTGVGLESCPASAATTSGACRAGQTREGGENPGQFARNQPTRLATDSGGSIYAVESSGNDRVQKFTPTGSAASVFSASALSGEPAPTQVAVDSADDHVYVAKGTAGVLEFDNSGNLLGTQGSDLPEASGLAVDAATKDVYYSVSAESQVIALGETVAPAVGIDPGSGFAVTPTSATLTGTVDPTGTTTGWHFEYVSEASFAESGFARAVDVPQPDATLPFTDEAAHPVGQTAEGLVPSTTYRVRLTAAKPYGGDAETSTETTFTTTGAPPAVDGVGVNEVQNTSADLVGYVDPNGQATSYRFEYGTAGPCASNPCASLPLGEEAIGSGASLLFVAQPVAGLAPRTEYHFRLVATNPTGPTAGEDDTFTTRAAPLPVGARGFELVSPAEKPGGQGVGRYRPNPDAMASPGVAATDGERYLSSSFAGNLTAGEAIYNSDYALSERVSSRVGWRSHSPFTHPEFGAHGGANTEFGPGAASAALTVFGWATTTYGGGLIFPQMASWPGNTSASYITDWEGRWELVAPTDPSVGGGGGSEFISADGSHLLYMTDTPGLLGPEDPSLDQAEGSVLYDDAMPGGGPLVPSDEFTPHGRLSPVGICTGTGAGRTVIPSVTASGEQSTRECPGALPGRSDALISDRGASVGESHLYGGEASTENAVSADGARVFFDSPAPATRAGQAACSGSGPTTSCPAQLYVRQIDGAGRPTVRWISRSGVVGQAASLMAEDVFEGASVTGSRVFFRTASPLSGDDPNGTGSAPVTGGTPAADSWDLYEYEVPSDGEGEPNGEDPGDGALTRISAGPDGDGDCDVSGPAIGLGGAGTTAGLRFASDDGRRLYFVCAAPLAGVPTNATPTDGTITVAGGSVANGETRDLYYYDAAKPLAERWEFVAELPVAATEIDECSTARARPGQPLGFAGRGSQMVGAGANCFKGTADGKFVTFDTSGRLVANDPGASSVDVYAFDAESDRLIRIDRPQGGAGGLYACLGRVTEPTGFCNGDSGVAGLRFAVLPGVATHPVNPGEHAAFFESKSRLVPADTNDQYDVYEWRDGKLSLISTGSGDRGAYYAGNSADGRDVFFETQGQLSWQDTDAVMDVYDARVGGGIAEPSPGTPACQILASGCQATPASAPPPPAPASATLQGPTDRAAADPKPNPYAVTGRHRRHRARGHHRHRRGRHRGRARGKRRHRAERQREKGRHARRRHANAERGTGR